MKLQFSLATFLLAIAAPLLCGCSRTDPIVDPLPPLATVKSMTISRLLIEDRQESATYPIPHAQWQAIYDALSPARVDRTPARWQLLATLTVARINSDPVKIELLDVSNGPGAFSVGDDQDWVCYRGGKSAELREVLMAAVYSRPH
jgi:hypothetical protein